MVKLSLLLPGFLRCGRSRSPKPLKANPSHATGVSSSSCHSPEHNLSQQGRQAGTVTTARDIPNDSAGQFHPDSQFIKSLVEPNSAQTPAPSSSVAPPPINPVPPSQTTDSDPLQRQDLLVVPGRSPATASQTSLLSQQSTSPLPQVGNSGAISIHESKNVFVQGDENNVNYSSTVVTNFNNNQFMEKLLEKTIPGAAFDSSARDPPPRCHPGTRLAILAHCLEFIANASGTKKMRWVVGKAGVGKSAIMQNVADSSFSSESPGASIFFSINGRNDGAKAIITFAYQLAAKCEPYRQFIEYQITRDPSLLQSSLSVQFKKFVVEPIIHHSLPSCDRILIIIDGLDECDKSDTQLELLQLIYDVCSTYLSSPIVWMIASRPEPHITFFFAQENVKAVCEEEEILVDSDTARRDVEKFLRDRLTRIQKEFSINPRSQWPREQDSWKLANASSGLFAFADTAIKYIGDRTFGNPKSQLNVVLKAIDAHPLPDVPQKEHPMARLDALYAHILSKVPERVMPNTRKILLALVWDSQVQGNLEKENFIVFCNWLGMTCDDAYAAIRLLSAVLDPPPRDEAHNKMLRSFHKSFVDYLSDFTRSRFSPDIKHEAYQLEVQCAFRILEQAPDGIDFGDVDYGIPGYSFLHKTDLARGPGIGSSISLAWPVDEEIDWNDNQTRLQIYRLAVTNVVNGINRGESAFSTESCIRLVTSRFDHYDLSVFPYQKLQILVFERSRRHDLIKHGILKQVPVKVLDYTKITWEARLRFRNPTATATILSHPWNQSCDSEHERAGDWGEGKAEDWKTGFATKFFVSPCRTCCTRLERQLLDWRTRSPDHPTTILFTSADKSFVEFQFVDPDDGVSEWTYWLIYRISAEERRKLGSTV